MSEETKQLPVYRFRDTIRIELDVSDSSGVAEVSARFTTTTSDSNRRSIYLRVDAEGATDATVVLEQEVNDTLPPGEYRCEYVQLVDLRGNQSLILRPDIGFCVEGVPGDHEGPRLKDWRYGGGAEPPTGASVGSAASDTQAARRLLDETRTLAQQVSDFVHYYEQRSPFHKESIPGNMESPEYKELAERYNAHIDEMRDRYRSQFRPEVIRVRGALSEHGITDAQLDQVYERPRTFKETEAVALRLYDMAGRLERRL